MKLYKCELIRKNIVVERFFSEGESDIEVLNGLEAFCWDEGQWRIEEA